MTTPDVFLPLLFKVRLHRYNATATNDLGNVVEAWELPEEFNVYGWGPPQMAQPKEVQVGQDRHIVEVELMVPPDFFAKHNDRIQLGSDAQIEAAPLEFPIFRVVGPMEDYTHNPFGWNPGSVVNLVFVKGGQPDE